MATSQIAAPNRSGRIISAWLKETRPALKLMNVLTTATEARAIPVAAGTPSSRTRPDDWRVKRPWPAAVVPPMDALVLAMLSSPKRARKRTSKTRFLERSRTIGQPRRTVKDLVTSPPCEMELHLPTLWVVGGEAAGEGVRLSMTSATSTQRRSAADRSIASQTAWTAAPWAKSGSHGLSGQRSSRSPRWLTKLEPYPTPCPMGHQSRA